MSTVMLSRRGAHADHTEVDEELSLYELKRREYQSAPASHELAGVVLSAAAVQSIALAASTAVDDSDVEFVFESE